MVCAGACVCAVRRESVCVCVGVCAFVCMCTCVHVNALVCIASRTLKSGIASVHFSNGLLWVCVCVCCSSVASLVLRNLRLAHRNALCAVI